MQGAAEAGDVEFEAPCHTETTPHVIPCDQRHTQTSNQPRPQPPPMRTIPFSCFASLAATTKQRAVKLAWRLLRVRHISMNEAVTSVQPERLQRRGRNDASSILVVCGLVIVSETVISRISFGLRNHGATGVTDDDGGRTRRWLAHAVDACSLTLAGVAAGPVRESKGGGGLAGKGIGNDSHENRI